MKNLNLAQKIVIISVAIALICSIVFVYVVSPTRLIVRSVTYRSNKVATNLDGMTIAYVSDFNLYDKNDLNYFNKTISTIKDQAFDMIIFGGDLYEGEPFEKEKVSKALKSIEAKYGKFAVLGDQDEVYEKQVTSVLEDGSIEIIKGKSRTVYFNNTSFTLSFSDEAYNLDINKDKLCINFVHQPDTFVKNSEAVDLQVSGHSLGGNFYIPGYGSVIKDEGFKIYSHGTHKVKNSTLIVSNGVKGRHSMPYKLLAANEILLINLKKESAK